VTRFDGTERLDGAVGGRTGPARPHLVSAAPVLLLSAGAVASLAIFAALVAADAADQLDPVYLPLLASLAGWMGLGWVLGHEPAPGSVLTETPAS
jgi:hypothetical protein